MTEFPLPLKLAPLTGKYYGTKILDADGGEIAKIWDHDHADPQDNLPSERERYAHGPFDSPEAEKEFWQEWLCDSHYEANGDQKFAEYIVQAVNSHDALVKALEQIKIVCLDNAATTVRHDLALEFVGGIAARALTGALVGTGSVPHE